MRVVSSKLSVFCLSISVVILASLVPTFVSRLFAVLTRPFSSSSTSSTTTTSASTIISSTTNMAEYAKELELAQLAVQRAAILTKAVFNQKAKGTLSKDDASPVTIGDFGAQALIIHAIKAVFPNDEVVGEEEASELRDNIKLRDQIFALVEAAKLDDPAAEEKLGGPIKSVDAMLDAIDAGNSAGGNKGRIWALDPIDGTKGFLRGGQYAVCLALMVDGDVKVGVLGCPNLPVDDSVEITAETGGEQTDDTGKGVVFAAVSGQGAISRAMTAGALAESRSIGMKPVEDLTQATFCESVEAGHSNHGDQFDIATKLGVTKPSVRMDSQAKYASIARGAGDIYLRLPTRKDYREKIWDHAAGDLIVREAGGAVTDVTGKRLDFSIGRTLDANKGVVAAPVAIHPRVLEVVKEVLGKKA